MGLKVFPAALIVIASLVTTMALADGVRAADAQDLFPKIANISIGAAANYGDAASHARYDLNLIGMWRGWGGGVFGMRQVLQAIKALNPDIKLGKYTQVIELNSNPGNTATADIYAKISSEKGPGGTGDWWARDAAGNILSQYPGTYAVNFTRFTTPDRNGLRYPEWLARRDNDNFFAPIPEFDIWYIDNVNYRPRIDPDWDGDGVNDSRDEPWVRQAYREGIAAYARAAKELQPNVVLIANVDGPGQLDAVTGDLLDPEYRGLFGGAVMEGALGKNYSRETWGSWEQTMAGYRRLMANTVEPHWVIFAGGADPTDYKMVRYIIASALMDNGYVAINPPTDGYSSRLWFDEYDLAGKAHSKWLGRALDPPQAEPWSNGVYRRRFENGMALVNPKGNGTATVIIEPGYRRFLGVQDPVTNNGESVTTITLEERDGLILVRDEYYAGLLARK